MWVLSQGSTSTGTAGGYVIEYRGDQSGDYLTFVARDSQDNLVWHGFADQNVVTPGEWHHVAVVIDRTSGTLEYYFDGEVVRSELNPLAADTVGTTSFRIGYPTTTLDFHGMMDDVRVLHQPLDADQVRQLTESTTLLGSATDQVHYTYDLWNRRIGKDLDQTADGTFDQHDRYVYDGEDIVLEYRDGSLANRYLHGPAVDQVLAAEDASGEVLWALSDHLGTVRDVVDYFSGIDTSFVVNHRTLDSFGQITSETNSAVDFLFAFTGREWDEDTGLQFNHNRWYDPAVGRWISEDPIGFAAGDLNLARYVGNSPSIFTDPRGAYPTGGIGLVWRYDQEGRVRAVWEESEEFQRGYHGSFGPSLIVTTGITIGGAAGAGAACGFFADQAIDTAFERTTRLPSPFIVSFSDALKGVLKGTRRFFSSKLFRKAVPADVVFRTPKDISDALDAVKRGGIVDAPRSGVTRAFTQLVDDIDAYPSKWKAISAHTEKATRKGARRHGCSTQTIYRNTETGETIVRHTVTNDAGRVIDDHWRKYYKPRVGDLFDGQ